MMTVDNPVDNLWKRKPRTPWIALDCAIFRNQKLEGLTSKAIVLYIASLCHCGDELTDGHVSTAAMRRLKVEARAGAKQLQELRQAGLLKGHGPWEIPDYLDWNPSRAHVEARREGGRRRTAQHRQRRRPNTTPNPPAGNASHPVLRNAPIEVEVEQEQVLVVQGTSSLGADSTTDHAATMPDMKTVAASAAQLRDRLRKAQHHEA